MLSIKRTPWARILPFWICLPLALTTARGAGASTNSVVLLNGKDLAGWAIVDFGGHGEVSVEDHNLVIGMGASLSGVALTNKALLPSGEYEVSLEAKKVDGSDFFCGLTFPVEKSSCTLIVGGWGGGLVGLSSIQDLDASENNTAKSMGFKKGQWYRIRLQVAKKFIRCWIDDEQIIDADIEDKKISLRPGEIYKCEPFGLATYETTAAIRNLVWRPITPKP
jgi:hypothetical protein